MEPLITIKAKLLDKNTGNSFASDGAIVKLYDSDIIDDDFLGQSRIDESGSIQISFEPADFSSADSPGEKHPDLYFTVFQYGKLLYKSKVMKNFKIDDNATIEADKGQVVDLGTFLI